jgi:hypothetical protein
LADRCIDVYTYAHAISPAFTLEAQELHAIAVPAIATEAMQEVPNGW